LAIGQFDAFGPQCLLDRPRLAPTPGGQLEAHAAQGRAGHDPLPQFVALGEHPVVLAAHQIIGRVAEVARLDQQRQHVRLPVADAHMSGLGQGAGLFGDALVALDPAHALENTAARRIALLELPRPGPGVGDAQRLALGADDVGGVQVQAALGFKAERPQPAHRLAVVVQFGGVLDAQHHRVLADPRLAGLGVGAQHLLPAHLFVAQESIRRGRFGPVLARTGNARSGLLAQPFGQQHCTLIQPRIAQLDRLKLLLRPAHLHAPCVRHSGR
jgi:hypothetical protein